MTVQTGQLSLVTGTGQGGDRAGLGELLADATGEVLVMSTGTDTAFQRIALANVRPGVRHKVLFPDSARMSGALNRLSRAGAEVRTDAEVPMDALVIDRTLVVLPAEGRQAGSAVFRLPGVVTATVGLFERIWQAAAPLVPLEDPESENASILTGREQELLTLLFSGTTDESAAARLGISVRTVRRMVADIMNRLGARSRFQAGAKAVDRGWLMAKAG
ncbi:helix-turn-helix transcriptional regulator [Amycolatopsis sp. BJA-103]|uniref:helix-turn-helix transcriptional regulator n=1 Tax=unclassified Amycolatopsis TaxID=2618356 RepID=UPI000C77155F|nr:helix-turn-helix transcriptional regulator [Amycolatopsis sp. BJA-103]AUI61011.1 helix-turn-helix transcriptional regulator [Amycolatopsis sp. BJA-103]PNE21703.1 helix-turn-helix transcriptional regulator [Amycolatopsis sp. BJA-103]